MRSCGIEPRAAAQRPPIKPRRYVGRGLGARPSRGPALRGLALALLALGLLVAQANRLFHELLVVHTLCEHGQLVHHEAEHGTIATPSPAWRAAQGAEATQGGAFDDDGRHAHCDARALVHVATAGAPVVLPASLLDFVALVPSGDGVGFRAIAVLELAPKASPPPS